MAIIGEILVAIFVIPLVEHICCLFLFSGLGLGEHSIGFVLIFWNIVNFCILFIITALQPEGNDIPGFEARYKDQSADFILRKTNARLENKYFVEEISSGTEFEAAYNKALSRIKEQGFVPCIPIRVYETIRDNRDTARKIQGILAHDNTPHYEFTDEEFDKYDSAFVSYMHKAFKKKNGRDIADGDLYGLYPQSLSDANQHLRRYEMYFQLPEVNTLLHAYGKTYLVVEKDDNGRGVYAIDQTSGKRTFIRRTDKYKKL